MRETPNLNIEMRSHSDRRVPITRPHRATITHHTARLVISAAAAFSMRFKSQQSLARSQLVATSKFPPASMLYIHNSHNTGNVICLARIASISSGLLWAAHHPTLDTARMRGVFNPIPAGTSFSLSKAGDMRSVWKAPATARGTAIYASLLTQACIPYHHRDQATATEWTKAVTTREDDAYAEVHTSIDVVANTGCRCGATRRHWDHNALDSVVVGLRQPTAKPAIATNQAAVEAAIFVAADSPIARVWPREWQTLPKHTS